MDNNKYSFKVVSVHDSVKDILFKLHFCNSNNNNKNRVIKLEDVNMRYNSTRNRMKLYLNDTQSLLTKNSLEFIREYLYENSRKVFNKSLSKQEINGQVRKDCIIQYDIDRTPFKKSGKYIVNACLVGFKLDSFSCIRPIVELVQIV